MKFVLATVAAFVTFTNVAAADGFSFFGYGEYAIEAESLEFGLGTDYTIDALTLSASMTFTRPSGTEMDLDHVNIGALYSINDNLGLYGDVELDGDFEYSETTLGVAFTF